MNSLLATLPIFLIGFAAPVFAQQSDGSFREFHRSLVPTPAQLFRSLSGFEMDGISGQDSNSRLNSTVLRQLEKSGRELFSQMSAEQKRKAREFADNFLSENGLETEEGKALMNQLGIPPELQNELAQQVKGWDAEDKRRFSSLAEMFSPDQKPSARRGNQDSRAMTRANSSDLANERSNHVNGLGEFFQTATENLGTDAQKKAAESTLMRIFDGAKKTLSRSSGDSARPQERLTSRFDRLLVKAVERSLEAKSKSPSNLELPDSVESALERVIGKVQDSIHDRRKTRAAIPPSTIPIRNHRGGDNLSQSNVDATNRSSSSSNDSATTPSIGTADLMGQITELSKINPSRLLLIMAIIGLLAFTVYMVWQYLTNDVTAPTERGLGRRFRSTRIRSPKDLVEAVDQVIIRKFGSESRWWNAKLAREVLCSSAPQYRASISDLLHDYVQARYSSNEPALTEDVQKQYKTTLKELSNLRTDSKSSPEATNGNES